MGRTIPVRVPRTFDDLKASFSQSYTIVERGYKTQCWEWNGTIEHNGYGRTTYSGGIIKAHRLSWMIHFGDIPNGICVCHHCDNPKCCNPEHLFIGSHRDNLIDRNSKGRYAYPKGENHSGSKLTNAAVKTIRKDYVLRKVGLDFFAKLFSVDRTLIHLVLKRKIWKHVK